MEDVNLDYLSSITGGIPEVMSEIIQLFAVETPIIIKEMNEQFEQQNYFELGKVAHKAKGTILVLGLEETAKMLKVFELEAKESKNIEKYNDYINEFTNEFSYAIEQVSEYL